jgi:hypothetical protein
LPVPVILNRLDTDFFVLMPLGRRINLNFSIAKEREIYAADGAEASLIFGYLDPNQSQKQEMTND